MLRGAQSERLLSKNPHFLIVSFSLSSPPLHFTFSSSVAEQKRRLSLLSLSLLGAEAFFCPRPVTFHFGIEGKRGEGRLEIGVSCYKKKKSLSNEW